MAIINRDWIGLHIYTTSNRIKLLKDTIIPLVVDLLTEEQISNYFYILYEDKGFHIRLRLLPTKNVDLIIATSKEKILNYLKLNPSGFNPNRSSDYYPQDSVQIIDYIPEFERYGGLPGILISEKQFRQSTDLCFSFILNDKTERYNAILNAAIKIHLTTAFVYTNGNLETAILFFQALFQTLKFPPTFPLIQFDANSYNDFHKIYKKQEAALTAFVRGIWIALEKQEQLDTNIDLIKWRKHESDICSLLNNSYNNSTLSTPFLYENYPLWSIVYSYIHMTNNRLGIVVVDEPLIAYMIFASLKSINLE